MHGEFVSLKQRPLTNRAVCYRIELAVAKTFMPGKPAKYLSLTLKQFYPRFFSLKHSNSSKSVSPYSYMGGFVAVYLSKMAATMVGPRLPRKHSHNFKILMLSKFKPVY